jgi:uncharacterized protein YjbI with pentapeptide repeats
VEEWNAWRKEEQWKALNQYPPSFFKPDLSGADLTLTNLYGADLNRANLLGADLADSKLNDVCFLQADLNGANLHKAVLRGANLGGAHLVRANLTGVDLNGVIFCYADLTEANLSGAKLFQTAFGHTDLRDVVGLESCIHAGPSEMDYNTLAKSWPLPEVVSAWLRPA